MFKFNDTNIFTGQIKQLLSSFNLPKYRVYTKQQADYKNQKNDKIQALRQEKSYLEKRWTSDELADKTNHKFISDQYDEINLAIQTMQNEPDELNVIPTIYRNNYDKYSGEAGEYDELMNYAPYIKDDIIQEYIVTIDDEGKWSNGKWVDCHANFVEHINVHLNANTLRDKKHYFFGQKDLNYTEKLKVNNNIYDTYTHEYLGNYLRFIRDYRHIDFMPLYNCFSERQATNMSITVEGEVFNTSDSGYKIYIVPVKLFKKYTIAIDCDSKVSMFCGIYGKYLSENSDGGYNFSDLASKTFIRYNNLKFNKPVLYSELADNLTDTYIYQNALAQNECNLKLFIKLPITNTSSVTILEGDYTDFNDRIFKITTDPATSKNITIQQSNHTVITDRSSEYDFRPISQLQLLRINTGTSYPFADRLMEFLTGNMITPYDENNDNIERAETIANKNWQKIDITGFWDPKLSPELYRFMTVHYKNQDINHDIFGFVDKDTEKQFISEAYIKAGTSEIDDNATLANIDIYLENGKHEYK